jgi:hypothetical protein
MLPALYVYALLLLKQSRHFKLLVSRGSKGREVIVPPQVAHFHPPAKRGFSLLLGVISGAKSSGGAGSLATSAKSGMSGASEATDISGSASASARSGASPFFFLA